MDKNLLKIEKFYAQIKNSAIFYSMNEKEIKELLKCFKAQILSFSKGDLIIRQGDNVSKIYLILKGSVNIEKDTYWANRMIISRLCTNDSIALSQVALNFESPIDAVVLEEAEVLVLNYEKCTSMCQNACTRHKILINNLFSIISKENINLIEKIENISQKSIKDKILTFLSNEARKNKTNSFSILFNRQELADYLNIDRSAMCFELSKLKKAGLIDFEKNKFVLSLKIDY